MHEPAFGGRLVLAGAEQADAVAHAAVAQLLHAHPGIDAAQQYNLVNVTLRPGVSPDLAPLERNFLATSACGVCGKASLDAIRLRGCPVIPPGPNVAADVLYGLPDDSVERASGYLATLAGKLDLAPAAV